MASEGIEVHEVRGDHLMLLREPNVAILAQELRACLDYSSPNEGKSTKKQSAR